MGVCVCVCVCVVCDCACSVRFVAMYSALELVWPVRLLNGGLYVLLLSLIYFNDSCQTNYLEIYRTDLRQNYGCI